MSLKNYTTMDVQLLLGLVNTTLRNDCEDLDDLTKQHNLDREVLVGRLREVGQIYVEELNQFRPEMG